MKLGIDLDGVLVDFDTSYMALIKEQTGIELPPVSPDYPDVWDYELAGGVTREQRAALWRTVGSTDFWGRLMPLPGALDALSRLNDLRLQGHDIYFITSRLGEFAKFYTEMWLHWHGMQFATVLLSFDKGPVARGLKLDVFIDDKPENNLAVGGESVRTYLIDRAHNKWATNEALYGIRVSNVMAVLERELPIERKKAA